MKNFITNKWSPMGWMHCFDNCKKCLRKKIVFWGKKILKDAKSYPGDGFLLHELATLRVSAVIIFWTLRKVLRPFSAQWAHTVCLCNRLYCSFIVNIMYLPFASSVAEYRQMCVWINALLTLNCCPFCLRSGVLGHF